MGSPQIIIIHSTDKQDEFADTAITVTFTAASGACQSDTVNTASVAAGDRVSLQLAITQGNVGVNLAVSAGLEFGP